eukprot:evm.model.scf_827.5 EVM.evm.TU.scf_827.5   scf_827:49902-60555(+)
MLAARGPLRISPLSGWFGGPSRLIRVMVVDTDSSPGDGGGSPKGAGPDVVDRQVQSAQTRPSNGEASKSLAESAGEALRAPTMNELLEEERQATALGLRRFDLDRDTKVFISHLLKSFQYSGRAADKALQLYVNAELWPQAASRFRRFLLRSMTPELKTILVGHRDYTPATEDLLLTYFSQYVHLEYTDEIRAYKAIVESGDMRRPHDWYPISRALQRRIIYHAGPTNSGKTHNALAAFKAAGSGIYCGPLRLLAMEVYDTCNQGGLHCNLLTGQEQKQVPGARHTSCTVEMARLQRRHDVCVIDEIQCLEDEQRGFAWTRALQGIPANEVHLCGDQSALPLVRQLCHHMDEEVEVKYYERFTTLKAEDSHLVNGYADVQPGDCVVCFSRKEIFDIKRIIEVESCQKVCVVYGALPPETRRQQARLFNEPGNGFDVLVASDAVGMGLNLNIRRVIFHTLEKHEGRTRVPISAMQIKQIAGRAGRRNSVYPDGLVTCLNKEDLDRVAEVLSSPPGGGPMPAAGLFPEFPQIELFASQMPSEDLSTLLWRLSEEAKLDGLYFLCKNEGMMQIAKMLQGIPQLSLRDRYTFCMAPANTRDPRVMASIKEFATVYSRGYPVPCRVFVSEDMPSTEEQLRHLETSHQIVSMWLYLSNRFDEQAFPGQETGMLLAAKIIRLMDSGLQAMSKLHAGRALENILQKPRSFTIIEQLLDDQPIHKKVPQLPRTKRRWRQDRHSWAQPSASYG